MALGLTSDSNAITPRPYSQSLTSKNCTHNANNYFPCFVNNNQFWQNSVRNYFPSPNMLRRTNVVWFLSTAGFASRSSWRHHMPKDQGIVISISSPWVSKRSVQFTRTLALSPTLNFVKLLKHERTQSETSCSRESHHDFLRPGGGRKGTSRLPMSGFVGTWATLPSEMHVHKMGVFDTDIIHGPSLARCVRLPVVAYCRRNWPFFWQQIILKIPQLEPDLQKLNCIIINTDAAFASSIL